MTTEAGLSKYLSEGPDTRQVIRIMFEDNGPGIPAEVMSRIFDPFFTTKSEGEGTGLGLAVCHGIITEHNGHIWAESKPGVGATFLIEIPLIDPNQFMSDQIASPSEARFHSNINILIVEDETNVAEIIARLLQHEGYSVDIAHNGIEGLAYIAQKDYALILCDIRIPEMNGPEFYRRVKTDHPQFTNRFIFMSGDTSSPSSRKFLEETQVPFIGKPFELHELMEKIQSQRLFSL